MGGLAGRMDWVAGLVVPPGVAVDVVDFGYRVTIDVTRGDDSVTLIADLTTGDAAQASALEDDAPLVRFARIVLAARMVMEFNDLGPAATQPRTEMRDLVEAAGAHWIRTDLDASDQAPQESRTDSDV